MKHNHGTCPEHGVPLICPACIGAATSKAKAAAARLNGAKGGRPPKKKAKS